MKEDAVLIWQLSQNTNPVEISTKASGVEKHFYGKDGVLENRLSEYEDRFASSVQKVRDGTDPNEFADLLAMLFWTQAIRTKSTRENFGRAMQFTIAELVQEATAYKLRDNISGRVEREFDTLFVELMSKLPGDQRIVAEESFKVPQIRQLMIDAAKVQLSGTDFVNMISRTLFAVKQNIEVDDITASGSQRALSSLLERNEPPTAVIPDKWEMISFPDRSLILGDICVFYSNHEGKFGGAGKFGTDWCSAYLPISHNQVLVGTKGESPTGLSAEMINFQSACLSSSCIFASQVNEEVLYLSKLIGTVEPLIGADELTALVSDAWAET